MANAGAFCFRNQAQTGDWLFFFSKLQLRNRAYLARYPVFTSASHIQHLKLSSEMHTINVYNIYIAIFITANSPVFALPCSAKCSPKHWQRWLFPRILSGLQLLFREIHRELQLLGIHSNLVSSSRGRRAHGIAMGAMGFAESKTISKKRDGSADPCLVEGRTCARLNVGRSYAYSTIHFRIKTSAALQIPNAWGVLAERSERKNPNPHT